MSALFTYFAILCNFLNLVIRLDYRNYSKLGFAVFPLDAYKFCSFKLSKQKFIFLSHVVL